MHIASVRRAAGLALATGVLLAVFNVQMNADQQPLTVLGTFDALDPPFFGSDESIAAGPVSLMVTNNGSVNLRQKTGAVIATMSLGDFFASSRTGNENAFDVRAVFDNSSGRFFLLATGSSSTACNPAACPSHYFLAVSKTSGPASLGAGDWYFSALDATLDNASRTARWADFPSLGVSEDALVITSQMFPFGEVATGTNKTLKIRVLNKQPLLSGGIPRWVDFTNITDPTDGRPLGAAVQPAHHLSSSNTVFVTGFPSSGCGLVVFGIQNAATAPTLTSRAVPSGVPCGPQPPAAPQPGGSPVVSFGNLRAQAAYRNGSLWVAQGVGKTLASGTVSAIRLSQIDVSQWPNAASMVQDAVFADEGAGLHYPTLTVDASSNVALIYGRSSATDYLSLFAAGRLRSDPLNTIRPAVAFKAGNGSLTGSVDASLGGIRFADYYGAAVDPVDGTVWLIGEYGRASTTLGLGRWVGHVAFPPDPSAPPKLTLTLSAASYSTRDTMTLTATLTPGATPSTVDAYVVVRTPSGQSFSLRLDGSLIPGIVPLATRFSPFQFTGDLARIPFTTAIPAGRYTWQTYLTEPGTSTVVGVVNETSFTFTP